MKKKYLNDYRKWKSDIVMFFRNFLKISILLHRSSCSCNKKFRNKLIMITPTKKSMKSVKMKTFSCQQEKMLWSIFLNSGKSLESLPSICLLLWAAANFSIHLQKYQDLLYCFPFATTYFQMQPKVSAVSGYQSRVLGVLTIVEEKVFRLVLWCGKL